MACLPREWFAEGAIDVATTSGGTCETIGNLPYVDYFVIVSATESPYDFVKEIRDIPVPAPQQKETALAERARQLKISQGRKFTKERSKKARRKW